MNDGARIVSAAPPRAACLRCAVTAAVGCRRAAEHARCGWSASVNSPRACPVGAGDRRPSHGLRRVGGVITGVLIALVFVLWIAARVGWAPLMTVIPALI